MTEKHVDRRLFQRMVEKVSGGSTKSYIESSRPASISNNKAWANTIITEIKCDEISKIEMLISDWEAVKGYLSVGTLPALFGGYRFRMRQEVRSGMNGGTYPMIFGNAKGGEMTIMPVDDFEGMQRIIAGEDGLFINGIEYSSGENVRQLLEDDVSNFNIAGQWLNENGPEWGSGHFKLYYCKIWGIDGSLLLDLIPAENNGQGCLKDKITGLYLYGVNPWIFNES